MGLVAGASLMVALVLAGCLSDPDSGPITRPIDVQFVRFPSPLAPYGLADSLDVAYLVGPDLCWYLKEISLTVRNDTILVTGFAKKDDPDGICPTATLYGERRFALPPLEPGTYLFRSCMLQDTLVVAEDAIPAGYRITLKGLPSAPDDGCALVDAGPFMVGLSNFPETYPSGTIRIWADQIDSDPCGRSGIYDCFATVRHVAEYSP